MSDSCCNEGSDIMLLSCSGGSNVGQLANQATVELTQEGFGKMFCLSGIGAHLSGFVQSAKDVPAMVAIDGCSVGCAKAMLEHANISPSSYLVLTEEGIEKNKNFKLDRAVIEKVKNAVKRVMSEATEPKAASGKGSCSCC